jgi:hypothetical protein
MSACEYEAPTTFLASEPPAEVAELDRQKGDVDLQPSSASVYTSYTRILTLSGLYSRKSNSQCLKRSSRVLGRRLRTNLDHFLLLNVRIVGTCKEPERACCCCCFFEAIVSQLNKVAGVGSCCCHTTWSSLVFGVACRPF